MCWPSRKGGLGWGVVLPILYFGSLMHTGIHDISYLYLGLLSYLPFCSSKFVNKEVENSNEMLIKSVRELKRFPHLGGGFTSQYAPVGWEFAKICNDVKSNPHLGPGWGGGGGGSGFQLISALIALRAATIYYLLTLANY